jgi:hypothetical protein
MIVYVGAGSGPLRDLIIAAGHGNMVSRQVGAFRNIKFGRWAFDNGAFTDWKNGEPFNEKQFLWRVRQIEAMPLDRLPDWCVCPDMVGKRMSLLYSLDWRAYLEVYTTGLKWYLAVQDYMVPEDVEYAMSLERFHGLFIGGTTRWKHETSSGWVELGHSIGVPVHIARVNGARWLKWAVDIGADSVDGTGWVRAGAKWLPLLTNMPKASGLPVSRDIPEEWLEFEAFLHKIYNEPEAWRDRIPGPAEDDEERYDRIAAMDMDDFIDWYNRMYRVSLSPPSPGFRSKRDFKDWKFGLVDEAERFLDKRPVPPVFR